MVFIPRNSKKKAKGKGKSKQKKVANKKAITEIVKSVVNKNMETKLKMYYSNANGLAGDGTVAQASTAPHNQFITSNQFDILRLLPFVYQGTTDSERIGESIRPIKLDVHGTLQIDYANRLTPEVPTEIYAVVYVLEHVFIKQYTSLFSQNNFAQLLSDGQNNNQAFEGDYISSTMPVSKQYYKLLKKKVIPLRYAGSEGAVTVGAYSIANAHQYRANFMFSLGEKGLPASLKYPENTGTVIAGQNDPTNSAIFMCVGFYNMNSFETTQNLNHLQAQYTTALYYKDG